MSQVKNLFYKNISVELKLIDIFNHLNLIYMFVNLFFHLLIYKSCGCLVVAAAVATRVNVIMVVVVVLANKW